MTAMVTGHNTNGGVIGLDDTTEFRDFNNDGDGARLVTLAERAKAAGMRVGVVSTARITHATPAANYAHIKICRCSASSSGATWNTSTTARRTRAASRASRR